MSLQTKEAQSAAPAAVDHSAEAYRQVLATAERHFRSNSDWMTFFREVLGVDGVVRRTFPRQSDLTRFEQSHEFDLIQQMLVKLREKRITNEIAVEPTRVITVRLPKSMHEYLRTEADARHTSMNKLCISKLVQMIGEDKIPQEASVAKAKAKAKAANAAASGNHAPQQATAVGRPVQNGQPLTPLPMKAAPPRF